MTAEPNSAAAASWWHSWYSWTAFGVGVIGTFALCALVGGLLHWTGDPAGQSPRIAVLASKNSRLIVEAATCGFDVSSIEIGFGTKAGSDVAVTATWRGGPTSFLRFDAQDPSNAWGVAEFGAGVSVLTPPFWVAMNYVGHPNAQEVGVFPTLPNAGEALSNSPSNPRIGEVRSVPVGRVEGRLTATC